MTDPLIGSTTAVFDITLSVALTEPVDVAWSTKDGTAIAGTDYEAANGVVTFLPGETSKQIQVTVYGQDVGANQPKNFYITLTPPSNAILNTPLVECIITVEDDEGTPITSLIVAQGKRGLKGDPGLSAYDQAVIMGYTGTIEDWMNDIANAALAADRAEDALVEVEANAAKAEAAASAAAFAGRIFQTPAAGVDPITGVPNGYYYNVRSTVDGNYIDEYQNVNGVPTATGKSYPSATAHIETTRVDDGTETQKVINDKSVRVFNSIADLLNYTPRGDGQVVYVKSYHTGLNKGGGTFVYNSAKSAINDGVVCFNGWVRSSFVFITSSMAGCVIDGVTDDAQAFQRGVDYTAQNNFAFYVDEGVHYLNSATFKRWGSAHNYQTYCPIIELKYSNISVIGKSEKSVLKYGDGITYTGWYEIGYVGAQLFSASPALQIDNFELIGCTIDGNGYNNKIRGLNGGGSSAGSQAVFINKGDNTRIVGNKFKDLSGYQALFIAYDTEGTLVEGNEFVDTGWLDGTNWTPNYTDQSTIFLGGTYLCRNNKLIQTHDGMFAGTACELHGVGTVVGNYIEKYASSFLSAAVVINTRTTLLANSVIDCTMFLGTDTQHSWNNYVSASGNYFRQRTFKIDEGSIYGKYRAMLYFYGAYNPTSCQVVITGNTFDTDRLYVGSTDSYLKQYNSVIAAAHVTAFTFSNNTIRNHKGHFLRLLRQSTGIIYTVSNNTFDNCGVDNSTDLGNSIVYFDNDGDQDHGIRPAEMNFANNTFKSCKYGQYFGGALDVLGEILCPYNFVVDNDVHDNWLATLRVKTGFQVNYDFYNEYNYKVNSTYNAAKNINGYVGGYNAVNQRGEIKFIEDGVSKSFKKTNNTFTWFTVSNGLIRAEANLSTLSIPPNSQVEHVFNNVIGVNLGMSAKVTLNKFLNGAQMWSQVTASQQIVVYFRNNTATTVSITNAVLSVDVK